jgi:hypothetical protein
MNNIDLIRCVPNKSKTEANLILKRYIQLIKITHPTPLQRLERDKIAKDFPKLKAIVETTRYF